LFSKKTRLIQLYSAALFLVYCFSPLLTGDGSFQAIYAIPIIVLLYPFGIYTFLNIDKILINKSIENREKNTLTKRIKSYKNLSFSIVLVLSLITSGSVIGQSYYDFYTYEQEKSDYSHQFEWIVDNVPEGERVAVSNCPMYLTLDLTHYTGLEAITLPHNLDNYWLEKFIVDYDIDFLFIRINDCHYDTSISPYKELFSEDARIIFGNISFNLVNDSSDSDGVIIYWIEDMSGTLE